MSTFSEEEIQAVVERLTRGNIRRPYDVLGVRSVDVTFNDVQEAAAGVFLLYPKTPYYIAYLAKQRLEEHVRAVRSTVAELLENIRVLRRQTSPVKDVAALVNAKSALLELEGVVAREDAPKDISKVPAYVRFNHNVDRFIEAAGWNIKDETGVVPTPEEARGKIPSLVRLLRAQVAEVVWRAECLAGAVDEYEGLGLQRLLTRGVVQRARQLLGERADKLSEMSETERLTVLRETILELLGAKAVVRRFGALQPKGEMTGEVVPFADKDRPAHPARLVVGKSGPYALVVGDRAETSSNVLQVRVDGSDHLMEMYLPTSMVPSIESTRPGPYVITEDVNDKLTFYFEHSGLTGEVHIPAGTWSAEDVALAITGDLATYGFGAETFFAPLMYTGEVIVKAGNKIQPSFGAFPKDSVKPGDLVEFYWGEYAGIQREVIEVLSDGPRTIVLDGAPLTEGGISRIRYGAASKRVRVVPLNRLEAVRSRHSIQLKLPDVVARNTAATFGMFGELLSRGEPTAAKVVADFITKNHPRLSADAHFEKRSFIETERVRTVPGDPLRAVMYVLRTQATWVHEAADVYVLETEADLSVYPTIKFMTVRLPNGQLGKVTRLRSPHALSVVFSEPPSVMSGVVDFGPDRPVAYKGILRVHGGVNAGDYETTSGHVMDLRLLRALSVTQEGPEPIELNAVFGYEYLALESKDTSLESAVELYDPLETFSVGALLAQATTEYVKFPDVPELEPGDFLDDYRGGQGPLTSYVVREVHSDGAVRLEEEISVLETWSLHGDAPRLVPRPRVQSDFTALSKGLWEWVNLPQVNVPFYRELDRLLQHMLVNKNPTASAVGSAEAHLRELLQAFQGEGSIEELLGAYYAPVLPDAEVLIKTFRERGADRAVDLLLACRFSEFFGLTHEDTSYAGAFQKAAREVVQSDLPANREGREASKAHLLVSFESPDYEVDTTDIDDSSPIDPD